MKFRDAVAAHGEAFQLVRINPSGGEGHGCSTGCAGCGNPFQLVRINPSGGGGDANVDADGDALSN